MKIIYDISVLGLGHHNLRARTGIFRVVENVAYGLAASEVCDLNFCASFSWDEFYQSLDYMQANPALQEIKFILPKVGVNFHKNLKNSIKEINSQTKINFWHKCLRKLLFYTTKCVEFNTNLLSRDEILADSAIFHSPFYPLPKYLNAAKNIKKFLTVYDLIPILYTHFFEFNENHTVKKAIQSIEADGWAISISHSTKDDLCNYCKNLDPDRVFVTHLAASDLFYPCSDSEVITEVKNKCCIPTDAPYLLSLSTLEPRKNIDSTIRCFAQLVEQEKIQDLHLVLVGTQGWDYNKIFEEISYLPSLQDRIIITRYVSDEDLAPLYSGALAFVYPSFYEGFGLPPLEAMQCGVPVITSNTSSLPEVVGDAGIMVEPTDTEALCQSMLEIYNRPSLQKGMSLKSLERAKQFSWDKCTQQTINAYKTALDS